MKLKVFHAVCGGQIGWSEGGDEITSEDFSFLDGTHPENNSRVEFYCKTCETVIIPESFAEMWRESVTKQ